MGLLFGYTYRNRSFDAETVGEGVGEGSLDRVVINFAPRSICGSDHPPSARSKSYVLVNLHLLSSSGLRWDLKEGAEDR